MRSPLSSTISTKLTNMITLHLLITTLVLGQAIFIRAKVHKDAKSEAKTNINSNYVSYAIRLTNLEAWIETSKMLKDDMIWL